MARHESARYKLSYGWLRGEDWWGDPVSDNFVRTDLLLHPWVKELNATVPPEANAIAAMYIIGAGAIGAWAGHANELAVYTEKGWIFCKPTKGVRVGCEAPAGWFWWNELEWTSEANVDPNPPPLQGTRYDVVLWVGFEAEPNETVGGIPLPEDMTLPNGGGGVCVGRCETAPTAPVHIAVMRNYVDQIGTISFIPGSVEAGFTIIGDKPFAKGQALSFKMPSELPDYFRNYGATLRLILNNQGG
jgi:hypothetical protein